MDLAIVGKGVLKQRWDNKYDIPVKYMNREGNYIVPTGHKEDREPFRPWLVQ